MVECDLTFKKKRERIKERKKGQIKKKMLLETDNNSKAINLQWMID